MRITHAGQLTDAIKSARIQAGLTQQDVAQRAGYSRKWLSDVENNRVDPPASMLVNVMMVLDIPLVVDEQSVLGDDVVQLSGGL